MCMILIKGTRMRQLELIFRICHRTGYALSALRLKGYSSQSDSGDDLDDLSLFHDRNLSATFRYHKADRVCYTGERRN